jgi:dTDP-4-dehydrorhamnose 3,5-epimerase-like enzyme
MRKKQQTMDKLRTHTDRRGSLTLVEEGHEIPFSITRAYWIYGVPTGEERGKHANKLSYQYLIAVNGSVDITLEDRNGRSTYHLDTKEKGLLVPPHTWNELTNFSPDAVLLVLASHTYDPATYINSYEEFLEYIKK